MAKYAALGALLQLGTGGGPYTYTTIPGVQDFSIPLGEVDLIDVTSHDSPNGYEENVAGIKRTSPFTVPIVWDGSNTQHAALVTAQQAGTVVHLKATGKESTPKTYTFDALVRSIELQFSVGGAQMAQVSFKPSGAITID